MCRFCGDKRTDEIYETKTVFTVGECFQILRLKGPVP